MRRWRAEASKGNVVNKKISSLSEYVTFMMENSNILLEYTILDKNKDSKSYAMTSEIIKVEDREHLIMFDNDYIYLLRDTKRFFWMPHLQWSQKYRRWTNF